MKRKKFKKYNILICSLIIVIILVMIPSIVIADPDSDSDCDPYTYVNTEVKDKPISASVDIQYQPTDGSHPYAEPSTWNGNGMFITVESPNSGKSQAYSVFATANDVSAAKAHGLCSGSVKCVSADDIGLDSSNFSSWNDQIVAASEQEKSNGTDLDLSDDFSFWQAKETLRMDGVNVDDMSPEAIVEMANDIIHSEGKFSAAQWQALSVAVEQSTMNYYACVSGSGGKCAEAAQDPWVIDVVAAIKGKVGKKTDEGGTCGNKCPPKGDDDDDDDDYGDDDDDDGGGGGGNCKEQCKSSCTKVSSDKGTRIACAKACMSARAGEDESCPEESDDGGKTEIEIPNFSSGDACAYTPPSVPEPTPKNIPKNVSSGGQCGSTAVDITHEGFSAGCGYVTMLTTTTVTAQLPGAPSVVYAGKGFNWGGVSSIKNVSTIIWDTSALDAAMLQKKFEMISIQQMIACLSRQLEELTAQYEEAMNECTEKVQSDCNSCHDSCSCTPYTCSTGYCIPENCNTCHSGCQENSCSTEICDGITEAFKEEEASIKEEIQGYNEMLKLVAEELKRLQECGVEAYAHVGVSSETGTVSITNQKMNLDYGYSQIINSIKGVAKNSGLELKEKDLENYTDSETYLKVDTNFFVPYSVKNGTSGNLSGAIVGDISIPNYSCPITVTNNVLCTGNDCDVTSNLNLIYRPISLTNPFPNVLTKSEYRTMGSNWNEFYAEKIISNNRGVDTYDIYNLTPIYTITLTPSTIKEIRNYNKQNSLNDFDMDCVDGYKCSSKFLWQEFDGIVDEDNSCASSTGWDASCYNGGVSE